MGAALLSEPEKVKDVSICLISNRLVIFQQYLAPNCHVNVN